MDQIIYSVDLSARLYKDFASLVYTHAGISLGNAKQALVRSRLLKRLKALGLSSFEAYYDLLANRDPNGLELSRMLDAITTNKTEFFRENQHFTYLTESVLPAIERNIRKGGARRIRIWSAGCSSGEEPYTLAMVLLHTMDSDFLRDTKILATDLSEQMLTIALKGVYSEEKMESVPPDLRRAYTTKENEPDGPRYAVRPELKRMIAFRRLNLMDEKYPFSGKFDIIFCRNVMIYFDKATQEKLVNRYARYMQPGGHLFIGHSESLNALQTPFRFVRPTIYTRP